MPKHMKIPQFRHSHIILHIQLFIRWICFALLTGLIVGPVGAVFVYAIQKSTAFRQAHPWVLLTLPLGGVLIVWLYRVCKNRHDKGTNMVLTSLRSEAELPPQMAPLIFVSTIITHFCGGSAGREGAALQLGGSIGSFLANCFRLRRRDKQILILSGMSAAFSAIFGTPIAAVVFAMEVGCVGAMHYAALVPCTIASLTASYLTHLLGLTHESYSVTDIPAFAPLSAGQILLLGICCAVLSIAFCKLLHKTWSVFRRYFRNPYLRICAAAVLLLLLGLLFRTTDFYGVGSDIISRAFTGDVVWYAFLLKMLFTAITLGGGYKGGEIVPTFFIGATFGCTYGHLIGVSPSLCAAVGMIGMFCGVTNCPLAALFISTELFGMEAMPYCLLVIAVSYMLSGYHGLYHEQKFLYSKFTDAPVQHKAKK